jgi:hypothetical protein
LRKTCTTLTSLRDARLCMVHPPMIGRAHPKPCAQWASSHSAPALTGAVVGLRRMAYVNIPAACASHVSAAGLEAWWLETWLKTMLQPLLSFLC